MELRQIKYFTAIYEEGSLTRAARRLNVVQPALSQQLTKMEAEIGRPLFNRTHNGMVPTLEGEEAYAMLSSVIDDVENAVRTLSGDRGTIRGRVKIGVVASVANHALAETLRNFSHAHPEVTIYATGGYTTDLREMLRRSELDIIVINAAPDLRDPDIVDIITEEYCLIGAAKTPLKINEAFPLERLNELKLVLPSPRHGLRLIIDRTGAALNLSLAPLMEFDDLSLIESFVSNSDYFTLLPPIAVYRALRAGSLRAYPITPTIPRRLVYMGNPSRPLSAAAAALIDEVRNDAIDVAYDMKQALQAIRMGGAG